MRAMLDDAERRIRKGQMYSAFDTFDRLKGEAGSAAHNIALETLPAARRYYDLFWDKASKQWCAF